MIIIIIIIIIVVIDIAPGQLLTVEVDLTYLSLTPSALEIKDDILRTAKHYLATK